MELNDAAPTALEPISENEVFEIIKSIELLNVHPTDEEVKAGENTLENANQSLVLKSCSFIASTLNQPNFTRTGTHKICEAIYNLDKKLFIEMLHHLAAEYVITVVPLDNLLMEFTAFNQSDMIYNSICVLFKSLMKFPQVFREEHVLLFKSKILDYIYSNVDELSPTQKNILKKIEKKTDAITTNTKEMNWGGVFKAGVYFMQLGMTFLGGKDSSSQLSTSIVATSSDRGISTFDNSNYLTRDRTDSLMPTLMEENPKLHYTNEDFEKLITEFGSEANVIFD